MSAFAWLESSCWGLVCVLAMALGTGGGARATAETKEVDELPKKN